MNTLPLFENIAISSVADNYSISRIPLKRKTLLRYPGGKSRAVKLISSFIPSGTKEIVSPFFGGGSIEFACAENGIKIHAADAFEPLVNFWKCVFKDPVNLANEVINYFPLSKSKFYELQNGFF